VVSRGETLADAREAAYGEMAKVSFDGKYCRNDIGKE